jgi:hypothetical protein
MSSFHNETLYAGFIHDDRRNEDRSNEDPGNDRGILIRIAIEEICNRIAIEEWSIGGPLIIPQPNSGSSS